MRHIDVFAVAVLALGRCASAGSPQTFEWKGFVAPDQTIEIRGINGGVHVEPADSTTADVVATISGRHPDPADIRIEIDLSDQGVLICAVYPTADGEANPCHPDQNRSVSTDAKVDFVVHIPAQTSFKYRTVNGWVYADVPNNAIDAEMVNGRAVITTGASARSKTVNGSIIVSLGTVDGCPCDFTTVTGTIDVSLSGAVNAQVKATTMVGAITTDFPMEVHRGFIGSSIDGAIGAGGPLVTMSTITGSIHLREIAAQ